MYVKRAQQLFSVLFALFSLSITLYSIVKFIIFVSLPKNNGVIAAGDEEKTEWKFTIRALLNNSIWLVIFILHHSFGKHELIKNLWEKVGLRNLERSAYNVLSSYILLQMTEKWIAVEKFTIWSLNIKAYSPIWYIFILTHAVFWFIIFGGALLMDVPEILGIKQVYYDVKGLNDPSIYKAIPHNRLLSHKRHPSFTGFSLLFWLTNLMR